MFFMPIAATVIIFLALYYLFTVLSAADAIAARKLAD